MDIIEKNLSYFKEKHKGIYESYEDFGQKIHEEGGPLDEKSRWLIKVAVSAAGQHRFSLKTHIRKARKAGCSWEEIEHSILLVAPTSGFPTMMEAVLTLVEEESEESK